MVDGTFDVELTRNQASARSVTRPMGALADRLGSLVLALLVVVSIGCGPATQLEGSSWRAVAIDGEPPVPGREPTIAFTGGKVTGSGGCNGYGGAYRLEGDRITFSELGMTAMGCPGPEMDVEGHYTQLLSQVQRVVVAGDRLTLIAPAGNLDFIRVAP
jgi:heat shock protein HslJ